MLFMVICTWEPSAVPEILKRALEKGTQAPEGQRVIGEWTDAGGGRIFRLIETDDAASLFAGALVWHDVLNSEVVPVIGADASIDTARGK